MVGTPKQLVEWLFTQDRDKTFECLEYRQKRSLNANSYAWALIVKIANAMRLSKEEVYLHMLQHYGQSEVISIKADINISGYFKYYKEIGTGTVQGKLFKHYRIYKGSSEYDTQEMAILIDGIVEEAKNLDIETMTPAELERLKGAWKP